MPAIFHSLSRTTYKTLDILNRPDVIIKLECDQLGNSFKARGIINFLKHVEKLNELVTFTTGNHGIAVAAIAKELNLKAIIVSTNKLSEYKKGLIESYGAMVQLIDSYDLEIATEFAKQIAIENDFTFVPLFNNEYLLEGYSQIAQEVINDFEGLINVYFPVGSGSLLLANYGIIKSFHPRISAFGVEPKIYQRLNGVGFYNIPSKSIADSLSIDRLPSSNAELLESSIGIVTLDEDEIVHAMQLAFMHFDLIIEPGGAITLAAALKTNYEDTTKKIAVITGKNISTQRFFSLLQ